MNLLKNTKINIFLEQLDNKINSDFIIRKTIHIYFNPKKIYWENISQSKNIVKVYNESKNRRMAPNITSILRSIETQNTNTFG